MRPQIQLVAISAADGSLVIMQFITDDGVVQRQATDAAIIDEIAKAGITAASWRRIAPTDLPADRSDRDAWQDSGTVIAVSPTRKAALLDALKDRTVDGLQTGATKALATLLFQIMKGTVSIPQPTLTPAQFKALLKSLT